MMIGIDFGTTNSSVANYRTTGPEMIETIGGADFMPSVVADTDKGLITGDPAFRQLRRNPQYTYQNIKRYLGVDFDEDEHAHFQMVEGPDKKVWWQGRTVIHSGPVLVAEVLKSLLLAAEVRLGRKATGAVIAVPVDFREPQRLAILEAAAIAGLPTKKTYLFEEPYCAALSYGMDRTKFERVGVYDFGGGTFDMTILRQKGGNTKALGMSGSAQVGGADFDRRLAEHAVERFFTTHGEDLRSDPLQMVGITRAAEDAKKVLSRDTVASVSDENVAFPKSGLANLNEQVTRLEFEEMTKDLVIRTIASVNDALAQAKMKPSEIDKVLLVGGQSRMPFIREILEEMFGPKKIAKDGPKPELAVALGAAIRAAELDGRIKPNVMQMLVPASIGIRVAGGTFHAVVKRGEAYPVRRERKLRPAKAGQTDIELIVLQGEDGIAQANTEVWRGVIDLEHPEARVPVMMDVDPGGRLLIWIAGEIVYGAMEDAA
jgi:molecular chaperone DnaK